MNCSAGYYLGNSVCLPCPTNEALFQQEICGIPNDIPHHLSCPISFFDGQRTVSGVTGIPNSIVADRTGLVNLSNFSATIQLVDISPWLSIERGGGFLEHLGIEKKPMERYELLPFEYYVNISALEVGTEWGLMTFSVRGISSYPGCQLSNATLQIKVEAKPIDLNHMGGVLVFGWVLLAIVLVTCIACAIWVFKSRRVHVVRVMQPLFLLAVCDGVFLIGSSIVPISITDENASKQLADAACVATPWLLVMGFTIVFSALFSKLWRITKIFHGARHFRRLKVTEKDVMVPFMVLFGVNFLALLFETIFDAPYAERKAIDDDPANTISVCTVDGQIGAALGIVNIVVVLVAFILTCIQGYRARNIDDQFSESRHLLIALFVWVQILLIGYPVLFLVGTDSPTTSYFVIVTLIFSSCMSMMFAIFLPIYRHYREMPTGRRGSTVVGITGVPLAVGSQEPTVPEGDDRNSTTTHDATIDDSILRVEARIHELEQENETLRNTLAEKESFVGANVSPL